MSEEPKNAFEDNFEFGPVTAKELAREEHAKAAAKGREVKANGTQQGERNHSFYTAGNKGVPEPSNSPENEQEWHRTMMFLVARGFSDKEIASKLRKTPSYIGTVRRSPWFREQLEAYIDEEGRDSIRSILEGEVLNSVYTLIDIRDNREAKESDRRAAADSLLDRFLGKAPQTVQHVDGGRSEVAKEQARIEKQLAEVDEQLRLHGAVPAIEVPTTIEPSNTLATQPANQLTTPLE